MKVILGVVGSRYYLDGSEFDDYALVEAELRRHLGWYEEIISGGAKGADKLGIRFAERHRVEYREFLPNRARYGQLAYHFRDRQIAQACDKLLAFWNGESRGTAATIEYARQLGRDVEIVGVTKP